MKRLIVALVALFAVSSVYAGEVYARSIATITAGTTNVIWTVGKYDRPTVYRIDSIGLIPTTCTTAVVITYGDSGGSSNTVVTFTNTSGVYSHDFAYPRYLQYGDVLRLSGQATNGAYRIHYIQRDTRTIN